MDIFKEAIDVSRKAYIYTLLVFLTSYAAIILPFTSYMKNRPISIKLGYMPEAEMIKIVSGDQRYVIAEFSILRVLFYFGSLIETQKKNVAITPDYGNMYRVLETGIKLDPYNVDAYYFAQAAFTWEVGHAEDVNRMLINGMKYRTWDYTLPFYVGFNYAYFLKDFKNAALYMKKTAEISGDPLFTNLAARFFYESRRTDLGIAFLSVMEKTAADKKIKAMYALRKKALVAVKVLNSAVQKFKTFHKRSPSDLQELVTSGILKEMPADPYGGRFYIAEDGMIRSTSEFAFRGENK